MDEKVVGRSGEFITEDGNSEFWWNGYNYHNILPEEMIDAEIMASEEKS